MLQLTFRPYQRSDHDACVAIFDENCPEFFAPNERDDYLEFLVTHGRSYTVAVMDGRVVGAYGLAGSGTDYALRWILFSRSMQGRGLGTSVMARVFDEMRQHGANRLHIAASHKSAPFFARFGATPLKTTSDGWGPGMDRVDMIRIVQKDGPEHARAAPV